MFQLQGLELKNCFTSAKPEQANLCITRSRFRTETLRVICDHGTLNVIQISLNGDAFKSNQKIVSSESSRNSIIKLTGCVTFKKSYFLK